MSVITPFRSVLHVTDSLEVGGKERIVVDLANGQAQMGYDCHVVATRNLGPLARHVDRRVHLWCAERKSRWDRRGLRKIVDYLDRHSIGVVHSHNHSSSYLMRVVMCFTKRRPVHVVHDHNAPGLGQKMLALTDWLMLRNVDGYIAVSEALHSRAKSLLKLPKDRCVLIRNGVVLGDPHPPWRGRPTVVQVANYLSPKDHSTAVRVAAALRQSIPDLRWICVGRKTDPPDEYLRQAEGLVESLELDGCMDLRGACDDVRALLREANVGVLTSVAEGFPVSVLEYMAEGLPVVLTEVGYGPTIVRDAKNGFAVPPREPKRFADALRKVLDDRAQAERMGRNSRRYVEQLCSIEIMTKNVEALYRRLWERRRRNGSVF